MKEKGPEHQVGNMLEETQQRKDQPQPKMLNVNYDEPLEEQQKKSEDIEKIIVQEFMEDMPKLLGRFST